MKIYSQMPFSESTPLAVQRCHELLLWLIPLKRLGHIWQDIIAFDNLYAAYLLLYFDEL